MPHFFIPLSLWQTLIFLLSLFLPSLSIFYVWHYTYNKIYILTIFSVQFSGTLYNLVQASPLFISRTFSSSQTEPLYIKLQPFNPVFISLVKGNSKSENRGSPFFLIISVKRLLFWEDLFNMSRIEPPPLFTCKINQIFP